MLRFKFSAEILFIHHFLCEDLHKQYIQIPEHQESWEKTNPCETWLYSKLTDVPWPKGYLFSRDLCHVSRCSEHVRFTGASIEAKVISTAGVFREYFVTGLYSDILGRHDTCKGGIGDGKRSPSGWQEADLVVLQAKAHIPISRFVLQKDSRDSGYYSLYSRACWGPIKDPSLWCFNLWLFSGENTPLLWTRWCLLHAGSSHAVLWVPTCGFNYSARQGDVLERKERRKQGWPSLFGVKRREYIECSFGWNYNHYLSLYYKSGTLLGKTHLYRCMTPAVMFLKQLAMPFFFSPPPLLQIIKIPRTRPYVIKCLSSIFTAV